MFLTFCPVSSDLINVQVCPVEADAALNSDLHSSTGDQPDANKQPHSALPRPDNGCRVWGVKSNEAGSKQQLSVCVEMWGKRREAAAKTQVSLSEPKPGRRDTDQLKWLPVDAPEKEVNQWRELIQLPGRLNRLTDPG